MKKHLFAVLLCFVLIPAFLSGDDVATALYREGLKKYILKDYEGAIEDFDSALVLKPQDDNIKKMYINTLIKQANIEYGQNNLKKAESLFLKAYALSGEDEDLQKNLIMIKNRIEEEREIAAEQETPQATTATVTASAAGTAEAPVSQAQPPIQPGPVPPAAERIEVKLPFDIDGFIKQQDEENKRIISQIVETQRAERESLMKNIEENQKLLDASMKNQREERTTLYQNIEEGQERMEQNLQDQREERRQLYENLGEGQKLIDESLASQREERIALMKNMEASQKAFSDNLEAQREERDVLFQNLAAIARSQSEDRKLFSRALIILVGGGILLAILIFLGFMVLLKRRPVPQQSVYYEPSASLEFKPNTLLEYGDNLDESKLLSDDRYTDVVRAKRMRELYAELQKGNISWDVVQGYISELNDEVKSEILNIVENKVASGDSASVSNALEILLPFITEGETTIGRRSKHLIKTIAGAVTGGGNHQIPDLGDPTDPLSLASLLPMARMVDSKTGREDHCVRVAELSYQIAQRLEDDDLDPDDARRVGLAYDIGFLDISDDIFHQSHELSEEQYAIVKTHTERGLKLLKHAELTPVFVDGILYHHERLDGSGYPEGREGENIPLIARVIAASDFFDAVTSARPHRPALTVASAISMMEKLADKLFDRNVFNVITQLFREQAEEEV